jgi:hypothetical protein
VVAVAQAGCVCRCGGCHHRQYSGPCRLYSSGRGGGPAPGGPHRRTHGAGELLLAGWCPDSSGRWGGWLFLGLTLFIQALSTPLSLSVSFVAVTGFLSLGT